MTTPIEIEDLEKDPDWGFAARLLAAAKEMLVAEGELEPTLYCIKNDDLLMAPLGHLGDFTSNEDKDNVIVPIMRQVCAHVEATSCAFVHDVIVTETGAADWEATRAAGSYANLPDDVKRRVRRRAAILVAAETIARPYTRGLMQFFRRDPSIVFEGLIDDTGPLMGRFTRLLRRPGDEQQLRKFKAAIEKLHADAASGLDESVDSKLERFVYFWRTIGIRMGYVIKVEDDRVDLIRPDGEPFLTIDRAGNPKDFDALHKVAIELQREAGTMRLETSEA